MGLYSDSAKVGKIIGWVRTVVLLLLGIGLLIYGAYLYNSQEKEYTTVQGKILQATCSPINNNNQLSYMCDVTISYQLSASAIYTTRQIINSTTPYEPNTTIPIYVSSTNPTVILIQKEISHKKMGIILMACGGVSLLLSLVSWYALRYKILNAGTFASFILRR